VLIFDNIFAPQSRPRSIGHNVILGYDAIIALYINIPGQSSHAQTVCYRDIFYANSLILRFIINIQLYSSLI